MHVKIHRCFAAFAYALCGSAAAASSDYGDNLETTIRTDGSKEFVYTVSISEADMPQSRGGRPTGSMQMSGGSNRSMTASGGVSYGGARSGNMHRPPGERMDELINERLEKKLRKTGYCRDGWMELERDNHPTTVSLRGECNETASESDYRKFPNSE